MNVGQHNAKVFGKVAQAYTERYYNDRTDLPWVDKLLEIAPQSSRVLDVACGPGMYTEYIVSKGYDGYGVDLSPEMVELAKQKVPKGQFTVQDMLDLQFPDQYFSALLAAWAIAYVPSVKVPELLAGFRRTLMTGGRMLIIVQKGEGDHVEQASLDFSEKLYVNFFDMERLNRHIRSAGFMVLDQQLVSSSDLHSMSSDLIYVLAQNV